jgi:hypothetical protein
MIWNGGAILGAAITPIIVATVSEVLKRPTTVVRPLELARRGRVRDARDGAPAVGLELGARGGAPVAGRGRGARGGAPAGDRERPDPFGIWQADRPTLRARLNSRPVRLGLATGALAFVIGVVALTGTELLFGESVTGDERTTIFSRPKGGDSAPATTTPTTPTTGTAPEQRPGQTQPQTTPTAPEAVPTTPQPAPTTPEAAPTTPAPPAPSPEAAPSPEEAPPAQPGPQSQRPRDPAAPAEPGRG